MALLIPREKEYWQRKPTERRDINYSNQFADSLVACVVTDEVDLVSGIKYANRVDYGEYIHFGDVGYNAELDTQAGTIICDLWEESILSGWQKLGYGYDYGATDRQIVSLSKRGDPYARYLMGTHDVGGGYTPAPIPTQEKGIICLSYNSNDPTAAALRYHRNSILEASVAWKGLPLSLDSRKRIKCGGTHAVRFFYMLNRALDDDEAKCLSDAPYQVLTKKKTIFLLPLSYALIVQSLNQSQSLSSPTLTQANSIDPNPINQLQSISSPVVTQHHVLSPEPLDQSQSLEQPVLMQAHILTVDALSQAQSVGQPTVTQHNILTPDPLGQAQSVENVSLSIAASIVAQDMGQAQTVKQPVLTQHSTLTPAPMDQAQSLEEAILAVAGAIAVQGMDQAPGIERPALLQHHLLAVDALIQSQSLGEVTLDVTAALAVADMIQAQAIDSPTLAAHGVLAVGDLRQSQVIEIVRFGGAVLGSLDGSIVIYTAIDGDVEVVK